jgi:DNA-binding Lrp family transcriptional regulator
MDLTGNVTIAELSKELNMSAPKTTNLIAELTEDGLIKDYGKVDSTGGRRASLYGLVAESCFFVGVDIKKYYVNIYGDNNIYNLKIIFTKDFFDSMLDIGKAK